MTAPWTLENFIEALDIWTESENPSDDLRIVVTAWVMSRADDPYQGVRREASFDNYWYGTVPRSLHDDDKVVLCSYWIIESEHVVRCDLINTLSYPV